MNEPVPILPMFMQLVTPLVVAVACTVLVAYWMRPGGT